MDLPQWLVLAYFAFEKRVAENMPGLPASSTEEVPVSPMQFASQFGLMAQPMPAGQMAKEVAQIRNQRG